MTRTVPKWAFKVKTLKDWAEGRKLKRKGSRFRVVFWYGNQPIAEIWRRPYLLRWEEEYKTVYGRFMFPHPVTGEEKWAAIPYYHALEGFCFELEPEWIDLATTSPDSKYYSERERAVVRRKFHSLEETEPWLQEDGQLPVRAPRVRKNLPRKTNASLPLPQ